jgi:hypothetical protein
MNSSLNDIEWKFNKELEKGQYVQNAEFDVDNLNGEYSRADVDVLVTFNHLHQSDQAKLLYRTIIRPKEIEDKFMMDDDYGTVYVERKMESKYGQWLSIPLEKDSGLAYKAQFRGNYHFDYELQVLIEHEQEEFTEEIRSLRLYSDSIPEYYANINSTSNYSKSTINYSAMVDLYAEESSVLIESALIIVSCMGEVIDQVELITDENLRISHGEDFTWDMDRTIDYDFENLQGKIEPILYRMIIRDEAGRVYEHNFLR